MSQPASSTQQLALASSLCSGGIADAGTTVVMATHDPVAIDYVDTAYFVESGALHLPDRDELALWLTDGTEFGTLWEQGREEGLYERSRSKPETNSAGFSTSYDTSEP